MVWRPFKKVSDRRAQLRRKPSCYLDRNNRHPRFPVCDKSDNQTLTGAMAALRRARMLGRTRIVRKAKKLVKRLGGGK